MRAVFARGFSKPLAPKDAIHREQGMDASKHPGEKQSEYCLCYAFREAKLSLRSLIKDPEKFERLKRKTWSLSSARPSIPELH